MPYSVTKKDFSDYRYMRMEIARLQRDDCNASDIVRGSYPDAPYTAHPVRVAGIDIQRLQSNHERIETLAGKCAEIETIISLAPTSKLRMILSLAYLEDLPWSSVADQFDTSIDSVRVAADRYLDNILGTEK